MNGDYTGLSAVLNNMIKDVTLWNSDCNKEIRKAMNKIQGEMLTQIQDTTPVRKKVPKDGVIRVRGMTSSHQPGGIKAGWIKSTVKNTDKDYVLAVRNKAYPSLIHLVNFTHDHYSWGEKTGITKGTEFVSKAQEEAREKRDKKIKEIYGR